MRVCAVLSSVEPSWMAAGMYTRFRTPQRSGRGLKARLQAIDGRDARGGAQRLREKRSPLPFDFLPLLLSLVAHLVHHYHDG